MLLASPGRGPARALQEHPKCPDFTALEKREDMGRERDSPYLGYFPATSSSVSGLSRTLFPSRVRSLLLAPARDAGGLGLAYTCSTEAPQWKPKSRSKDCSAGATPGFGHLKMPLTRKAAQTRSPQVLLGSPPPPICSSDTLAVPIPCLLGCPLAPGGTWSTGNKQGWPLPARPSLWSPPH